MQIQINIIWITLLIKWKISAKIYNIRECKHKRDASHAWRNYESKIRDKCNIRISDRVCAVMAVTHFIARHSTSESAVLTSISNRYTHFSQFKDKWKPTCNSLKFSSWTIKLAQCARLLLWAPVHDILFLIHVKKNMVFSATCNLILIFFDIYAPAACLAFPIRIQTSCHGNTNTSKTTVSLVLTCRLEKVCFPLQLYILRSHSSRPLSSCWHCSSCSGCQWLVMLLLDFKCVMENSIIYTSNVTVKLCDKHVTQITEWGRNNHSITPLNLPCQQE